MRKLFEVSIDQRSRILASKNAAGVRAIEEYEAIFGQAESRLWRFLPCPARLSIAGRTTFVGRADTAATERAMNELAHQISSNRWIRLEPFRPKRREFPIDDRNIIALGGRNPAQRLPIEQAPCQQEIEIEVDDIDRLQFERWIVGTMGTQSFKTKPPGNNVEPDAGVRQG